MNRRMPILVILLSVTCGLTACNRAKDATAVAKDTSAAQQAAGDKVAAAQQQADARLASARGEVRDEQRDLQHVDAVESQKVADAAAAGEHKVALARCEGLSGSSQQSCKDHADADYEAAEARAKQQRAASDPKP